MFGMDKTRSVGLIIAAAAECLLLLFALVLIPITSPLRISSP